MTLNVYSESSHDCHMTGCGIQVFWYTYACSTSAGRLPHPPCVQCAVYCSPTFTSRVPSWQGLSTQPSEWQEGYDDRQTTSICWKGSRKWRELVLLVKFWFHEASSATRSLVKFWFHEVSSATCSPSPLPPSITAMLRCVMWLSCHLWRVTWISCSGNYHITVVVGTCDTICDSSDCVTTSIHHMTVVMKFCDDTFFIPSACAGSEYVAMECIDGDNNTCVQLEPRDVTLVQVELCRASLHVRTTDAHPIEGMSLPHCYAISMVPMEWRCGLLYRILFQALSLLSQCVKSMSLSLPILPILPPVPFSPSPLSLPHFSHHSYPQVHHAPHRLWPLVWYHGNHCLYIQLPSNEWTYHQRHRRREGENRPVS